ncbi:inositol monophosphatase family protein [Halorhodospira halophila]|uniref:Inositol-1-monophosphatase n=1 Tax=Halorhodospira halophila (strain DSM 244 / SL1) TaxID=349124 RepID=A1WXZ8_HALHL|nr:inositol monophosphatase family protein [Halorhodospira halophila]ABM62560.1 Inositol-phosphate phosphatase [Halorhodospira halophila SL1]MBK1728239.1 inositol monophosphatase [Halorhodospira halophila]
MHPMVNIAVRAARAGGDLIVRNIDRLDRVQVESKGRYDFVCDIDRQAEAAIVQTIQRAYPQHAILAEEGGLQGHAQSKAEYTWIIDPLDGTANFLRGYPHIGVSIAVQKEDQLEAAAIYDPLRQELFTASRGNGAQLDGRRIRVPQRRSVDGAMIGTGFPFKNQALMPAYLRMFSAVTEHAEDMRRAGSAALDLAYVAAGRLDGYFELGLKPWDIAGGTLLVREAGGIVTDITGEDRALATGHVVAGAPKVHSGLLNTIRAHAAELPTG